MIRRLSAACFETSQNDLRWKIMSDAHHYFHAHAVAATRKARSMPFGSMKEKQRTVARVYHVLAKEAAYAPNLNHMDDFRAAQKLERQLR
jgi:hypothetical protein